VQFISRFGILFWGLCIGVIALYGFFVVMGGFAPDQVIGLTLAVLALSVLYLVHTLRVQRELHKHGHEELMHELHKSRERRGF
jgi:hypothetical protein